MFTWSANPAVPSNPMARSDALVTEPATILSPDGSRSFTNANGGDAPSVLLPIAMWSTVGTGSFDAQGNSYPSGGDEMGIVAPPFDLSGGSGKGKRPSQARDQKWLKAQGFDHLLQPSTSAGELRHAISHAEGQIQARHLSDADIATHYVSRADWRTVGAHLDGHPTKMAAVNSAVQGFHEGLNWFKSSGTPAAAAKKIAGIKASIQAHAAATQRPPTLSLSLKGDKRPRATLELSPSGQVQRMTVDDLAIAPTLALVTRIMRDLEVDLAPTLKIQVGGRPYKDRALVKYIKQQTKAKK